MARKRQRGRHMGRFEAGETFAAIPVEILRSEAYAALPDYAARVLLAVAAQYRGMNNGNLSLALKAAREHGIRSAWKVQAGLRLLREVGMVELTRPGKYSHGKGISALYAVTWKAVNATPQAFPPIDYERPAPNTWAKWQKPDDWQAVETNARRLAQGASGKWNTAHDHSRRQEQASSRRQEQGTSESAPTSSRRQEQGDRVSSSRRLGDLLDSGRGGHSSAVLSSLDSPLSGPGGPNGIDAKIAKLVRAQPHLTNADIARILAQYQVDAVQVAAIRAGGAP